MKKCILIVFLAIFLALPVNGEVFKWTDSRGTVHFTDDIFDSGTDRPAFGTETPPKEEDLKELRSFLSKAPASKDNGGGANIESEGS
jgi:hypothetical protein